MRVDYPLSFITHHLSNIKSMGWAAIRNANPITRPAKLPALPVHLAQVVSPISNPLIDAYAHWSGATSERYIDTLPPHFCSHWSIPLLANLGGLAPYNLLALLNQGLRMQIHLPLLRNQAIHLEGSLMEVLHDGDRVRIHTQVRAHNPQGELACTIDSYSTVPQKGKKKTSEQKARAEEEFDTIGTWDAQDNDGLNFAFLTGDFNPIHTIPAVGRRSRFKTLILHGFGQLARSFEAILNSGYTIAELDVRWIKPLNLPSQDMQVQVGRSVDSEGFRGMRLVSAEGVLHMVGKFREE